MNIRKLDIQDLDKVLDLIDEFDREQATRPSKERLVEILQQLHVNGGCVLGAEINDTLAGTCTLNICQNLSWSGRPYGILENVLVTQSQRSKGIGKALLKTAETFAEQANCYKLALMTGSKRESTLNFYERAGFTGNKTGFQKRFQA